MAKGAVIARIISEYSDKGSKAAAKDIQKLGKDIDAQTKKIKHAFEIATVAFAAFAIKIGVDSVKAAMEEQKSQALLAKTLQNTVGASDSLIASVDEYIKKQELSLGVQDSELRPSLAALVTATHDVTKAQDLQSLALDISANKHKDLGLVSVALAKAYAGNFNQLKRLAIPLSENLVKSKDFVGITKELAAATGGSAAVAANTLAVRMERVKLGFEEAKKSLGFALMPAVSNFLNLLNNSVLPALQQWIDANKQQLADALQKAGNFLADFLKHLVEFGLWVSKHTKEIQILAGIIATMWVTSKIAAFVTALGTLAEAWAIVRNTAAAAAVAEAFGSAGITVAAGATAAALLATSMAAYGLYQNTKSAVDESKKLADTQSASQFYSKDIAEKAKEEAKQRKIAADWAKQQAASQAASKAATDKQIASQKALNALKGLGVTVRSETDPIELEAARLNLLKQANVEEQNRIAAMMANLELQMATNTAAQRYADILQVLADSQISSEEVSVLAGKWNITTGQVEEYIARIFAANATPANVDSVLALYMSWGLTKDQAKRYIDFAVALSDQKLSDAEIEKLRAKWGMTRDEVLAYAKKVQDGTVFSTTWGDAGGLAKKSWEDALTALNDYLAKLKGVPALPSTPEVIPTLPIPKVEQPKFNYFDFYSTPPEVTPPPKAVTPPPFDYFNFYSGAGSNITSSGIASFGQSSVNNSASTATGTAGNTTIIIQGNAITQADNVASMRDQLLGGYLSGKPMSFSVAAI